MYVYLLHFHKLINPNRPAQHYLGFAKELDERITSIDKVKEQGSPKLLWNEVLRFKLLKYRKAIAL
ncbi:MAG: endonuclease [Fischerella sp. CENA71]|nr:endonuclease [Fischerella sp. CENA71]